MTTDLHTSRRPRRRPSVARAGFTLIEILVAAAVGAIAIGGAFAFAKYQITSYRTQGEIANMNSGANVVFESMVRDIRSAAFGSSFYTGATPQAFNGRLVLMDGAVARGVPALMGMNAVTTNQAMVGSDALTVVRVEGEATHIPTSGAGVSNIPAVPGTTNTYTVQDLNVLRICANRDIDGDGTNDGLVIVADLGHHNEPASFILPIATIQGTPPGISFSGANGTLFGLSPTDTTRPTHVSPNGAGPGSVVACVRPVTYWVDSQARLRMWRASSASPNGAGVLAGGLTGGFSVPFDNARDVVLAEGVEDMQISYLMGQQAVSSAGSYAFSTTALTLTAPIEMAEVRAVRVNVLLRTPRRDAKAVNPNLPASIEDRTLPTTFTRGCTNTSACIDPEYSRKLVTFQAEVRNMIIFDRLSRSTRTTAQLRSFMQ